MQEKNRMENYSYLPLIIELRWRILSVLTIFFIAFFIGLIYYEKIIRLFLHLLAFEGATIVFSSPFEYMNLAINCGFITGVIAVLPFVFYQLIGFLKPALTKKEFRLFKRYAPFSLVLFLGGFTIGFLMIKYVGNLSYQAAKNLNIVSFLNISNLLSVTLLTATFMGLAFQFPLVLILLIRFQVVSRKSLVGKRPIAYIIAIIFASLMPPTDILSLILLTIPLVILFELVLLFTKGYQ